MLTLHNCSAEKPLFNLLSITIYGKLGHMETETGALFLVLAREDEGNSTHSFS